MFLALVTRYRSLVAHLAAVDSVGVKDSCWNEIRERAPISCENRFTKQCEEIHDPLDHPTSICYRTIQFFPNFRIHTNTLVVTERFTEFT